MRAHCIKNLQGTGLAGAALLASTMVGPLLRRNNLVSVGSAQLRWPFACSLSDFILIFLGLIFTLTFYFLIFILLLRFILSLSCCLKIFYVVVAAVPGGLLAVVAPVTLGNFPVSS